MNRISFALVLLFAVACAPVQRPTPTPARATPRILTTLATFTPAVTAVPLPTDAPIIIPLATNTTRPTARPASTRTPTRQPTAPPTATATPLPPTALAPTATPTATTPPFRYKSANKACVHSGQTFIQGTIYRGTERINGVTIAMSGYPDGEIVAQRVSGTDGEGFYSLIVNASGASPGQKRWVWIVENGKRSSDIVQFDFNDLKASDPATCWNGIVDFVQQY